MKLPLFRVAEFISASGDFNPEAVVIGYSIDSRTIQPGELFIAVKGDRLDGHDFVEAALKSGAAAAVVAVDHVERYSHKRNLLVVEETLTALQTLGAAVRRVWNKQLIAVTGSAGKTTTKEAIAHLLSRGHRVFKSHGNLNNHFGLPLQLLKLEPQHEIAVVELGMSRAGEIAALAKLAKPDCGAVTCVAPVHLEFFESVRDIAHAKYELIESIHSGGIAVLNVDDEYVSQFGRDFHGKVVTFGISHPADVRAEGIQQTEDGGSRFTLVVGSTREQVSLPMLGRHNVLNALAAAATAFQYNIPPSEIVVGLQTLQPADKRGETLRLGGALIINDCYNSNPIALKSMIDSLAAVKAQRRIVVAGEMLELGQSSEELHRQTGEYAAGKADIIIGVRGLAEKFVGGAKNAGAAAKFLSTPEEAGEWLAEEVREGDVVLLKASRGVKLERALETLKEKLAVKQ